VDVKKEKPLLIVYEYRVYDSKEATSYDIFLYRNGDGSFAKKLCMDNGIEVVIPISVKDAKKNYRKYKYKTVSYKEAFSHIIKELE
jgi:hypothetical protein